VNLQKLTRAEALQAGAKRYFTGQPCSKGHVAERLVSNFGCLECAAEKFKRYYQCNADALRARVAEWRLANNEDLNARRRHDRAAMGDEYRAARREEYSRNADRERRRVAAYRSANPEKVRASQSQWQQANRHMKAAAQGRRKAA